MINEKLFRKAENHKSSGWYLKGNDIELFLTEQGGKHAPVTFFLGSDDPVQPYHLCAWQDSQPDLSHIPLLQNLRGDFFCLPFGGNAEAYQGEQHQCHGETSAMAWTMTKAEEENGRRVFVFEMDTKVRPAHVEKRIEMRQGHSALYIRHTVTGMSGKMPYGHHAILELPAQDEKMYFSAGKFDLGMTPTSTFSDPANWEYQFLASGAEFTSLESVPTIFKQPATADYSVYPSPAGYTDLFALFKKGGKTPAWATAAYTDRGYLFYSLKNADLLPSTTIWVANSGRYEFPWNGVDRCFAIEETCSYFADGLKPSVEENLLTRKGWKTCGEFRPDQPFSVPVIQGVVRIPSGYRKTVAAEFSDGKVTFRDESGLTASAAVDWKFLTD